MTDLRTFIRNMGKDAPAFFDVSPDTISRWLKTGSVPIKKAEKILAAINALEKSQKPEPVPATQEPAVQLSPGEDPYTHLPINMDKRLPVIQGKPPDVIEINPMEQSYGNNFTRPGRVSVAPSPPMKLRDEGGVKVAYVDTSPKTPTVLPPSISKDGGWLGPSEPLPGLKKERNLNEPLPAQRKTESVSSR